MKNDDHENSNTRKIFVSGDFVIIETRLVGS